MELKSVGLNSDLYIISNTSNVIDRDHFIKIETPGNPKFFWGNFLIFPNPPQRLDFDNWVNIFKQEFGHNSEIKHIAFTWDIFGGKPELEPFIEAGFILEETVLMSAKELKIIKPNTAIEYRIISSLNDWDQLVELQIETGIVELNYNPKIYREFVQRRFSDYKMMADKKMGQWFGAFVNGKLVSDLGLFGDFKNMRFQSIETKTEHRNRGIAQNLMAYAANQLNSENYILQADSKGKAIDLYMKMGFEIKEVISFLHKPST
jgi:GNAT superfamily N-acetyltransferase